MSNLSKVQQLRTSAKAQHRFGVGIRLVIAVILIIFSIFPILWVISASLNPTGTLATQKLIPDNPGFGNYQELLSMDQFPFWKWFGNSLKIASITSVLSLAITTVAGYAFSRFRFPGRQAGMLGFIIVQMLPSVATVTALFVLLNIVLGPQVRNSIAGVGVAMIAGALPFAIWNMKGFIDTIPMELEEAAYIDGASANQTFFRIMLPLALPGLAVTALLGFMAGWTEFVLSWQFISNPKWFTLSMALYGMQGQYAANTPWSQFAAMSIVVSVPVVLVFFALQKYIVGGLTLGGVKG